MQQTIRSTSLDEVRLQIARFTALALATTTAVVAAIWHAGHCSSPPPSKP